ncbi:MAG TPA: hypothetical protein PLB28_08320 [Bacteroidales bacterium]|jgi:hypothetical protein|nr:hypothetical protein [Paludibacter sp.]MDD4033416.1 hypothetical protein [Bacteroidales bacterium]MDD4500259.1 hypothetical protein [Bacteroidales bacterium]HPS25570.1 hypothetical protein [Bacteroidales bacterium]
MKTVMRSLVMLALLFVLSGCDLLTREVEVRMKNRSDDPVHLWVGGEESIGPDNKVSSGGSRSVYLNFDSTSFTGDGDISSTWITVYAGRNGEVLTSDIFEVPIPGVLNVSFNGSSLSGSAEGR